MGVHVRQAWLGLFFPIATTHHHGQAFCPAPYPALHHHAFACNPCVPCLPYPTACPHPFAHPLACSATHTPVTHICTHTHFTHTRTHFCPPWPPALPALALGPTCALLPLPTPLPHSPFSHLILTSPHPMDSFYLLCPWPHIHAHSSSHLPKELCCAGQWTVVEQDMLEGGSGE